MSKNLKRTLYIGLAALLIGVAGAPSANAATNLTAGQTQATGQAQAAPSNHPQATDANHQMKATSQSTQKGQEISVAQVKQEVRNAETITKNAPKYKPVLKRDQRVISQMQRAAAIYKTRNHAQYLKIEAALKKDTPIVNQLKNYIKASKQAPKFIKQAGWVMKLGNNGAQNNNSATRSTSTNQNQVKPSQTGRSNNRQVTDKRINAKRDNREFNQRKANYKKTLRESRHLYDKGYQKGYSDETHKLDKIEKKLIAKKNQVKRSRMTRNNLKPTSYWNYGVPSILQGSWSSKKFFIPGRNDHESYNLIFTNDKMARYVPGSANPGDGVNIKYHKYGNAYIIKMKNDSQGTTKGFGFSRLNINMINRNKFSLSHKYYGYKYAKESNKFEHSWNGVVIHRRSFNKQLYDEALR